MADVLRFGVGAVVAATLVIAVVFASRFGVDPDYVASAVVDQQVPSLTLPELAGDGTIPLDDMHGTILVVNFWASWCTACRLEHDDLLLAASRYADFGVEFVGMVYADTTPNAVRFLDELGWGYRHVTDPGSRAAISFGVRGVPETCFIDRDGTIVTRISGESTVSALSAVLDKLVFGALEP